MQKRAAHETPHRRACRAANQFCHYNFVISIIIRKFLVLFLTRLVNSNKKQIFHFFSASFISTFLNENSFRKQQYGQKPPTMADIKYWPCFLIPKYFELDHLSKQKSRQSELEELPFDSIECFTEVRLQTFGSMLQFLKKKAKKFYCGLHGATLRRIKNRGNSSS